MREKLPHRHVSKGETMTGQEDTLKEKLKEAIENRLGAEYAISFREIEKNNGLRHEAVAASMHGVEASIDITRMSLLEKIRSGAINVQEAGQEIAELFRGDPGIKEAREVYERLDKPYILGRVTYQLINRERNAARLKTVPYKEILDLAAVYRLLLADSGFSDYSVLLSHDICGKYGINEEVLDAAAKENTDGYFHVCDLGTLLAEMCGIPEQEMKDPLPAYVFTNWPRENGASILLYKKYFDRLSREIEDDLYILPSSIHDLIVVPAEKGEPEGLRQMVCEINANVVKPEEILSMNVYRYSREKGMMEVV